MKIAINRGIDFGLERANIRNINDSDSIGQALAFNENFYDIFQCFTFRIGCTFVEFAFLA